MGYLENPSETKRLKVSFPFLMLEPRPFSLVFTNTFKSFRCPLMTKNRFDLDYLTGVIFYFKWKNFYAE